MPPPTKKSQAHKRSAGSAASLAKTAKNKRQRAEANAEAKAVRETRRQAAPPDLANVVPETPSNRISTASEDVDRRIAARRARSTMAEAEAAGFQVCSQEQLRTYCVVAYRRRFEEPDEVEWAGHCAQLSKETGMNKQTIREVFRKCRDGVKEPEKQKEGAGRPRKLPSDNPGLVAAAIALNSGQSPNMATELCNRENESMGVRVCRNTLMATLEAATDVQCVATLRAKTGKKDTNSPWAKARLAFSQATSAAAGARSEGRCWRDRAEGL